MRVDPNVEEMTTVCSPSVYSRSKRVLVRAYAGTALKLWGSTVQRELAKVAGWSFAAAIIARGANLITLVMCARILTQDQFGQVAIIQSTVGMFGPIAGLGLSTTVTKFIAEYSETDRQRAGRVLALSLAMALAAGLLMTGSLILLAPQLASAGLGAPSLRKQLTQASGLLVLGVVESVQTGALIGLQAFSQIARLSVWSGVLSIPAMAALAYNFGVSGAIAGLVFAVAVACLLDALALRAECRKRAIRLVFSGWGSERRELLNFSLPSYLSGLVVAPVSWLGNALLVNHSSGFAEMALFSAADRYRFILIFIPISVSRTMVPALSRFRSIGNRTGYQEAFRWNLGVGVLATLPPALLAIVFAQPLMHVFGESFRRGWPVLAILAASTLPTVLNTQLGAVLVSGNRVWARAGTDVVLAIVFLSAAWWAIPRWNAVGLAGSFGIAYTTASVILWVLLVRDRGAHGTA